MAGFIVGFDGDGPGSFEGQRELLRDAPLPLAMAGLLIALPGTALWRRLDREGRLRDHSDGDAFTRPNFTPTMPERELIAGYADLLAELQSTREDDLFERLHLDGAVAPSMTRIAGKCAIRAAIVNHRTSIHQIETLVERVKTFGMELESRGAAR